MDLVPSADFLIAIRIRTPILRMQIKLSARGDVRRNAGRHSEEAENSIESGRLFLFCLCLMSDSVARGGI